MENNNSTDGNTKDQQQKLDHLLKIYLTEGEKDRIEKMAKTIGVSYSAFGRAVLFEYKFPKELIDLKKIKYELNKIGTNLNQLTRVANQKGQLPKAKRIDRMRRKIKTQINRISYDSQSR